VYKTFVLVRSICPSAAIAVVWRYVVDVY
jgi:hypothetical protein